VILVAMALRVLRSARVLERGQRLPWASLGARRLGPLAVAPARCFSTGTDAADIAVVPSQFPIGSPAHAVLDQAIAIAEDAGYSLTEQYAPYLPIDIMQTFVMLIIENTGLTWTSGIVLSAFMIRLLTLPVSIRSIRSAREKSKHMPEFNAVMKRLQEATQAKDDRAVKKAQEQQQKFNEKHGTFFPLKGSLFIITVQMPVFVTAFQAMRGFAFHPTMFSSYAMEAPLWLDSLALADPYAGLPILLSCVMLTNIQLFGGMDAGGMESQPADAGAAMAATMQKYMPYFMRGAALCFIPLTWNMPAGVFVYLLTSSSFALAQNVVLRQPEVEQLLSLPPRAKPQTVAGAAKVLYDAGTLAAQPQAPTPGVAGSQQQRPRSAASSSSIHAAAADTASTTSSWQPDLQPASRPPVRPKPAAAPRAEPAAAPKQPAAAAAAAPAAEPAKPATKVKRTKKNVRDR